MDLAAQIKSFIGTLSEFAPGALVNMQLGNVYNALLEETKKRVPDNPVVAAMQPTGPDSMGHSMLRAGELRTLAGQLLAAI